MRRLYKQRIALLMLGLTLDAVALADGYVLDQALTKPVMSADGEVVEYAITFVLKDQRQRPISNMTYKIVLGTGQVVCGQSKRDGVTQRVSSGLVQTTANIRLTHGMCVSTSSGEGLISQEEGIDARHFPSSEKMPAASGTGGAK
jgi:hypothetical protein